MAAPPLSFLERKWMNSSSGGQLNEATVYRQTRRWLQDFNRDVNYNMGRVARRTLITTSRWLYENFSPVKTAIGDISTLATEHLLSQSQADDREWADLAETTLQEHNRIIDLAGWPNDYDSDKRLLLASVLVDGDCGILLTETPNGWPAIQMIPGHRIGNANDSEVQTGEFAGRRLIDGVIVNDNGTPLGYRILDEGDGLLRDVSANDMMLLFRPRYVGQVRGYPEMGAAVLDFQDIAETRAFEKLAQKKGAGLDFIVQNEEGEPNLPSAFISTSTDNETTGAEVIREKIDGGTTTYFRAGSGSTITPVQTDRPSANQAAFEERLLRTAIGSLGWSYELCLDTSKLGGASMRFVIDKANRALRAWRESIVEKACRRIDGWRVAKLIKLGVLPANSQWWMWKFQPAAELTADRGYESDISVQEVQNCMSSEYREAARRGTYPEDLVEDRIRFLKYVDQRGKEEGIDPSRIYPGNGSPQQKVAGPNPARIATEAQPQQPQK